MGVSSARPDDLDRYAHRSRSRDDVLGGDLERLTAVYHAFQSENEWGALHAYSLLSAYGRYIDGNGFTARWVAQIAATFRAAGGSGRLVRLPDAS
jgi:hypothetical protein